MKEMRKLTIVWGLVILIIFAGLTTFALLWKDKNRKYKDLEKELAGKVQGYYETKYEYPKGMEVITITKQDLINDQVIENLKIDNDECDGYVDVSNNTVIEYTAYIKCPNYTTKGYNK